MKKASFNTKSVEELRADLTKLQGELRAYLTKGVQGKMAKGYTTTRKNIARVMTALTRNSTVAKK